MAGGAPEHQQISGGLAESWETVAAVGVGQPGDRPVLQGGDTGGPYVQVVAMCAVRSEYAVGGGHPHGFYK